MADVSISYKGSTVAEINGYGTKTLKTSGKYCEGDVVVTYAPRLRIYEFSLTKKSGWIELFTLDSETASHINEPNFAVILQCLSDFTQVDGTVSYCFVSNTAWGTQGSSQYPVYGLSGIASSSTVTTPQQGYYPPNKTDTAYSLGGGGMFRLTSGKYYYRPGSYYCRAGNYRLTFMW